MDSLFGGPTALLAEGLSRTLHRQSLLASNVANLDTPGYVPVDLEFSRALEEAGAGLSGVRLRRTHDAHFASGGGEAGSRVVERPDREPGLDGNQVDLDVQMGRMAHTGALYAAQATAISKRLALLRYSTSQ